VVPIVGGDVMEVAPDLQKKITDLARALTQA
jgi:hypothetical protein